MPFFDKIRQALGFSDGEDDIDDAIIRDDAPSNKYRHLRENADTAQATRETIRETDSPEPAAAPPRDTDYADKAAVIFDRVIEVFNQSLPDFLKQSVDPEAQRKYLYKSLDDGLKAYIASLKDEAAREAEARWRKDNDALQTSVKNLEQRAREIEDKRSEISQKQMSSDRQRRALSERVHDLESTVARLEAEKEQFELERQSMVNKLKVAAVYEKENAELHEQIGQMAAERGNTSSEAADTAAIEALNAQVAEARQQAEEARKQTEDARQQAEEARQQAEELRGRVKQLQNQVQAEQGNNAKAQNTIKELQRQIEEEDPLNDPEIQRQLKEIQDRLEQYEQQKKRNEKTIASLKSQLEDERRKNAEPKATAMPEDTYRPIDEQTLKNTSPRPSASNIPKSAKPQDAPSIDDILGDTDWVVRQDNTGKNQRRNAERNKPKVDNDPQMKLF